MGFASTGDMADQARRGFKYPAVKKAKPKVGSIAMSKNVVYRSTAAKYGSKKVH